MGVCNCSMFCCTLLYVHSSIAIKLMGKRELIALLNLSSWCLVMVERLFLAVPRGCLQFVIVVFPDHTHLLFLNDYALLLDATILVWKSKINDAKYHQINFLSFTFKPEVRSSIEKFVITKWTNQVVCCLGYLVQIK